MEYHFKYAFTVDEFVNYNLFTVWRSPWNKKTRTRYIIKQAVFLTIVLLVLQLFVYKAPFTVGGILLYVLLVVFVSYLAYLSAGYGIANRARKLIRKEENLHMLDENSLTLNEQEIINVSSRGTTKFNWSSIIRYGADKEALYLYVNSQQGFLIPKRLFADKDELDKFDRFITEHVPLSSSFRSIS